ncbi:hypothetical protein [Pseudomonas sp. Irchel 3E13]|uniref:hypothetical protein n=1 Tax=Pseudomonas sp. Irchel 3E13 TaxID=2008975 RepID=UPI00117B57D8|nr:hypothetical protein [Pseudomonas sp. Irchel 3E13]
MANTSRCQRLVGKAVLYWRLLIARKIKKALENNRLNNLLIPQQPAPGAVANQPRAPLHVPPIGKNSFRIMTKR